MIPARSERGGEEGMYSCCATVGGQRDRGYGVGNQCRGRWLELSSIPTNTESMHVRFGDNREVPTPG